MWTRQFPTAVSLVALFLSAGHARAQNLGECFCLSNPPQAYFLWGCRTPKPSEPNQAICWDIDRQAESEAEIVVSKDWVRVPEGHGDCLPCRPPAVDHPDSFREVEVDAATRGTLDQ